VASRIDLDGFVETVNSGSYIKKTALRPLEDIDLFVGFDVRDYEHDSHRVVSRIHRLLLEKFSSTVVRIQRHSVGVAFADGIRVDVVPGVAVTTACAIATTTAGARPTSPCIARFSSDGKRPIPAIATW
jgi:tRNA nucleotidyltransferase (CCA-adding enzyme)